MSATSNSRVRPQASAIYRRPGARTAFAAVGFVVITLLLGYRVSLVYHEPGRAEDGQWGMIDFQDAVYFPTVAMLHGVNPYDTSAYQAAYPASNIFPLYWPLTLLVHLPFGLLPREVAEVVYFCVSAILALALAYVSLKFCGLHAGAGRVLGLATLILMSRPGHVDMILGQVALQVTLAAIVALQYAKQRPWISGLGLGMCSLKPSYAVPLALLMLCRRDWRAVLIGTGLGLLGALPVIMVLIWSGGGIVPLVEVIPANMAAFEADPYVNPATSFLRIDAFCIAARFLGATGPTAKLLVPLVVLIPAIRLLGKLSRSSETARAGDLSGVLICVALLICVHHQLYDAVLLVPPLVAVCIGSAPSWGAFPAGLRWGLASLLALPFLNWLPNTHSIAGWPIGDFLWSAIASINAAALLAAFVVCAYLAQRTLRDRSWQEPVNSG